MSTHRAPSQEQIKLLGELSSGRQLWEEAALARVPAWPRLETTGILPKGAASQLESLHSMSTLQRVEFFHNGGEMHSYLMALILMEGDIQPIQYLLTIYYESIRSDTSILDLMTQALANTDVFTPFFSLLRRPKLEQFTADKAAFLLSSLIPRASPGRFSDDDVQILANCAIVGESSMSPYGRLDCLKNLMKLDQYRVLVWETRGASRFIISFLDTAKPGTIYVAVFCAWLLTFNAKLLESLVEAGGIEKICAILRESKIEKVVRVCIQLLLNCLSSEQAVEVVIQENALHILTLLEYEKWRDEELYKIIRDALSALQQKIKLFSNFDRYSRELNSGKLSWSVLHSEKFWHENVMHFEENEFGAVKKLVHLLRSPDSMTLAIACFDLGEFSRLYPTGKKIIQKFKAKELVLTLMGHKDRDVTRQALLCVQKMMLDKWQNVAGAS